MKKFLFLCIVLVLHLSGCVQGELVHTDNLGCYNEKCKLVYDGFQYHTYDTELFSLTGKVDTTHNEFQYRLPKNDLYVTSGNSITNNFKIMKKEKEQLQTVYEHNNDKDAIFPVGVIDDNYIFAIIDYDSNMQTFKGFFQLNHKNELEQLKTERNEKTEKIFGIGISSSNSIYLLLYENEKQNLYKTNLSLSEFELVAENVSQNLSLHSDEVCYLKDKKLYCGSKVMKELEEGTVFAWVIDRYVLEVNEIGIYEIRDIKNHEILYSGSDFIGVNETSSEITIYSEGQMLVLEAGN